MATVGVKGLKYSTCVHFICNASVVVVRYCLMCEIECPVFDS